MAGGGGNFDPNLTIDAGGHIMPTGPLGDLAGGVGLQLRFWAIQLQDGRTGAYMAAKGQPQADPAKWETVNDASVFRHGEFQPGQAFATAVATLDSGDIDWWSGSVRLVPAASMAK
jgi:hypothetical protein